MAACKPRREAHGESSPAHTLTPDLQPPGREKSMSAAYGAPKALMCGVRWHIHTWTCSLCPHLLLRVPPTPRGTLTGQSGGLWPQPGTKLRASVSSFVRACSRDRTGQGCWGGSGQVGKGPLSMALSEWQLLLPHLPPASSPLVYPSLFMESPAGGTWARPAHLLPFTCPLSGICLLH